MLFQKCHFLKLIIATFNCLMLNRLIFLHSFAVYLPFSCELGELNKMIA